MSEVNAKDYEEFFDNYGEQNVKLHTDWVGPDRITVEQLYQFFAARYAAEQLAAAAPPEGTTK